MGIKSCPLGFSALGLPQYWVHQYLCKISLVKLDMKALWPVGRKSQCISWLPNHVCSCLPVFKLNFITVYLYMDELILRSFQQISTMGWGMIKDTVVWDRNEFCLQLDLKARTLRFEVGSANHLTIWLLFRLC